MLASVEKCLRANRVCFGSLNSKQTSSSFSSLRVAKFSRVLFLSLPLTRCLYRPVRSPCFYRKVLYVHDGSSIPISHFFPSSSVYKSSNHNISCLLFLSSIEFRSFCCCCSRSHRMKKLRLSAHTHSHSYQDSKTTVELVLHWIWHMWWLSSVSIESCAVCTFQLICYMTGFMFVLICVVTKKRQRAENFCPNHQKQSHFFLAFCRLCVCLPFVRFHFILPRSHSSFNICPTTTVHNVRFGLSMKMFHYIFRFCCFCCCWTHTPPATCSISVISLSLSQFVCGVCGCCVGWCSFRFYIFTVFVISLVCL